MGRLSLRARLVAAFVAIAALATLVAALLTSFGLHRSFDDYLGERRDEAARSSVALAESSYAETGGWTPRSLDLLAHELVLTGYDFRLVQGGRVLLDTTKLEEEGLDFRRIANLPVEAPGGDEVATLQLYALGPKGDTPADDTLRAELDRAHLIAAAIAAVVAIVAGLVVAGRLSSPLRKLAQAARDIAVGGSAPLPAPRGSPEVRDLGEALSGLADDLARQQRARRQLAQDLSHELRTPLMLLQSRIEAMQDGVVPFDAEGLATLHTETLRLSRLVGQIERLAEAEAQPAPLTLEEISLDAIASEAHDALAPAFEMRGLALELDASPTPARGERDAVLQIVMNLLSNALKYGPERGLVRLTTALEGDTAILRVRDDGDGMAGLDRKRVFERFFRGREAKERSGGAGIGLTIARQLAEDLGGSLKLEDDREGTSFLLRLAAAPGRSGPEARASTSSVPGPRARI